jgi:AcrR family transcriptional regulator
MVRANSQQASADVEDKGSSQEARERLFLAAEKLFAERGFDGVSVRDIIQAADVNLAAVSYYFGSKSELLLAVFRKRAGELNRERVALLREAETAHGGAPPLEAIIRAHLAPPILWRDPATGKDMTSRFITRAIAEVTPDLRKILESDVSHMRVFLKALAGALPEANEQAVCWALHFTAALPHQCTDTHFKRLSALSEGRCDVMDMKGALDYAVRFALAGIEALCEPAFAKRRTAGRAPDGEGGGGKKKPGRNAR